jgi:thiol-disulfide isomerase/thioredoxin
MAKLVLLKIGAKWCGPCVSMDKRGTLEKFQAKHPDDVRVEVHDDTEDGSQRWEAFADKWNVKATPSFIWTYQGEELFRITGGQSLESLEASYEKAVKKAEKLTA